ncbi:MAG: 4Fe-4S dicluster domain-containing protein [Rhizobiales bacterium]|nr:4Fe-4S dicluster domain-containing protein [Hyphomicrobiales bacterium]
MSAGLSRRTLFAALRPAEPEPPLARIGAACVEPKGVTCRRCGDECEPRAISFRLVGRGKAEPRVAAEACTGCGACLGVCPVAAIALVSRQQANLAASLAEYGRTA